jgi:hypothetical protein
VETVEIRNMTQKKLKLHTYPPSAAFQHRRGQHSREVLGMPAWPGLMDTPRPHGKLHPCHARTRSPRPPAQPRPWHGQACPTIMSHGAEGDGDRAAALGTLASYWAGLCRPPGRPPHCDYFGDDEDVDRRTKNQAEMRRRCEAAVTASSAA